MLFALNNYKYKYKYIYLYLYIYIYIYIYYIYIYIYVLILRSCKDPNYGQAPSQIDEEYSFQSTSLTPI